MTQIFNRSCDKETRRRLRRDSPLAEQRLWLRLRNRRLLGYRFLRQYGVGPYVLDFYCPELKLAIEIDGNSHFQAVPASTIGSASVLSSRSGSASCALPIGKCLNGRTMSLGGSRRLPE